MRGRSWWRNWVESAHDPKLMALSDKDYRAWHRLGSLACSTGGYVPSYEGAAAWLGHRLDHATATVDRLVRAHLLDPLEGGGWELHNWKERQFQSDSSTDRVIKHRAMKRSGNVSETRGRNAPEQSRAEQIRDTHQIKDDLVRRRSNGHDRKGSRIPADWQPDPADVNFAADHGLDYDRLAIETEKFRDYWNAKSGAGAIKRDWHATWRNWVRNTNQGRLRPTLDPRL